MSHIIETVKAQDGFLLNMKILSSKDSKALGSIVYYHGGGFYLENLMTYLKNT